RSARTTAVALHVTGVVGGSDEMIVIVPVIFSVPVSAVLAAATSGDGVVAISGSNAPVWGSRNPMTERGAPDAVSSADAEILQARPIRPAQMNAFGFMLLPPGAYPATLRLRASPIQLKTLVRTNPYGVKLTPAKG